MFVLRLTFALFVISLFADSSEAQLFRLRRNINPSQQYNAQQFASPSNYGANNYRYTQVQPTANYIPSQRYGTPNSRCNQSQSALVPVNPRFAQIQPRNFQSPSGINNSEVAKLVVVTYRDPYTGRYFQRQQLVRQVQPAVSQPATSQPAMSQPSTKLAVAQPANPESENVTEEALSVANPIAVVSPTTDGSESNDQIATTSFESPVEEFSVLSNRADESSADAATSVIESSLPVLELPSSSPSTTESQVESVIDIDLPPLQIDGK